MEKKPGKDPVYPVEYAHVERLVKDTQETVRQIDERIENLAPDRGPEQHYNPPGFLRSRQPGNRDAAIDKLKETRETLKAQRFNQVEKETGDASPEIRAQVRAKAREALFPNPYRTGAERNTPAGERRDLEQSQDYMDALRFPAPDPNDPTASRDLDQSQERMNALMADARQKAVQEKSEVDTPPANNFVSASARFTQTLHWSPSPSKNDGPTEPVRHRDVEQDRD